MKKLMTCVLVVGLVLAMTLAVAPLEAEGIDIVAQAAIVIDFDTGEILFERDIHTPRVPASMTKAMTAFVVYEEMERGNLTLETLIPISANAARLSRDNVNLQGTPFPLDAGTYHTVNTLLHLAMLPSSNGACVALAEFISGTEEAFAQRMNESAAAIGMWSEFTNSHGAIAHYTNAYSIGRLVYEFIHRYPDILRITGAGSYTFNGTARNNTNQLIPARNLGFAYSGADGFRTGTTREAGSCLASTAYRNGRRVIVVVMNTPNNDRRYNDSIRLLDFGFAEMARRDAERANAEALLLASKVDVVVGGQHVTTTAFPRAIENLAFVPARDFFVALGATTYHEENGNINMYYNGIAITLAEDSNVIYVDGNPQFTPPPRVIDGQLFVSVRYAAYALGRTVEWDSVTRTVTVSG
jgi:D-alanyl-D-alanine carboxypeptidase